MDQDPFGTTTREIAGGYELQQWEDGETYYLIGPSDISKDGYGAIDGTVGKIGWNEKFILVWQKECGSVSGWRLIDFKSGSVSSLFSKDEIDSDPRADGITTHDASVAWSAL